MSTINTPKYIYDNKTEYDPQKLAKEINDSFNNIKPLPKPPQQGWECPKCGSVSVKGKQMTKIDTNYIRGRCNASAWLHDQFRVEIKDLCNAYDAAMKEIKDLEERFEFVNGAVKQFQDLFKEGTWEYTPTLPQSNNENIDKKGE